MENEAQTAAYLNRYQVAARRDLAAQAEEEKKKEKSPVVVGKKLKISIH